MAMWHSTSLFEKSLRYYEYTTPNSITQPQFAVRGKMRNLTKRMIAFVVMLLYTWA
jgi:hypothetical protein